MSDRIHWLGCLYEKCNVKFSEFLDMLYALNFDQQVPYAVKVH